jgi:phage shock protein A
MNMFLEFRYSNACDGLFETRKDLIDLIAESFAINREVEELRLHISKYEGYVREALDKEELELAQDIAEKIVAMESELACQKETSQVFEERVRYLKAILNRLEKRVFSNDRLQYMIDYLDAATELEFDEDGSLEEKMRAAGIGKAADSGRKVLERIRTAR